MYILIKLEKGFLISNHNPAIVPFTIKKAMYVHVYSALPLFSVTPYIPVARVLYDATSVAKKCATAGGRSAWLGAGAF
jgi:predicted transcriptional regulator of viral defense system